MSQPEPDLAAGRSRRRRLPGCLAVAEALDLGPGQDDPGLDLLEQVVLVPGPAVARDDLDAPSSSPCLALGLGFPASFLAIVCAASISRIRNGISMQAIARSRPATDEVGCIGSVSRPGRPRRRRGSRRRRPRGRSDRPIEDRHVRTATARRRRLDAVLAATSARSTAQSRRSSAASAGRRSTTKVGRDGVQRVEAARASHPDSRSRGQQSASNQRRPSESMAIVQRSQPVSAGLDGSRAHRSVGS